MIKWRATNSVRVVEMEEGSPIAPPVGTVRDVARGYARFEAKYGKAPTWCRNKKPKA